MSRPDQSMISDMVAMPDTPAAGSGNFGIQSAVYDAWSKPAGFKNVSEGEPDKPSSPAPESTKPSSDAPVLPKGLNSTVTIDKPGVDDSVTLTRGDGTAVSKTVFGKDGTTTITEYGRDGSTVTKWSQFKPDGTKHVIEHDKTGKPESGTETFKDGSKLNTLYKPDGSKTTYLYDGNGELRVQKDINDKNKVEREVAIRLDKSKTITLYDKDGKLDERFEYDSNGRWLWRKNLLP